MNTWVLAILFAVIVVGFLFIRSKHGLRLGGIDLQELVLRLQGKSGPGSAVERLEKETEREREKVAELQSVLGAKQALAEARKETSRLQKEIAGVDVTGTKKPETVIRKVR